MAELAEDDKNVMVCPFYLNSSCSKGDKCEFAHTMTNILPKHVPCEYHQRRMCKYRKKCWFSHDIVEKSYSDVEITDESDSVINHTTKNEPGPIKMRFSFILKDIQDKRLSKMLECQAKSNLKKMVGNISKLGSVQPMENCFHYYYGVCPLGDYCECLHGEYCDFCQKYCLNPFDSKQKKDHIKICKRDLEDDIKLTFAYECGREKSCYICLEKVYQKSDTKRRIFGILENCNHVFCIDCIQTWRRNITDPSVEQTVNHRTRKSCPTCRAISNYVVPSEIWFYDDEEKSDIIKNYKSNLKLKHCKFVKKGKLCPFENSCFYLHATSN